MSGDGDRGLTYQNLKFSFEVSPTSLLLVAHQGCKAHLLLAPETEYTRKADSLGVSEESKIGSRDFDHKYVIRDSAGKAEEVLTPEVVALVEAMEPFTELEMSDDMVRLLKKPAGVESALKDIQTLAELCQSVR